MILYIWRHGKAETGSVTGRDEDRALAPEGRNEVIDVADHLFNLQGYEKPQKVFTSPYLRAKESAEMIQGFLGCEKGLEVLQELKSGTPHLQILEALRERAQGLKSAILVGHIPDLESLAREILQSNEVQIHLKPGGLLKVEAAQLEAPYRAKLLLSMNPENISS